MKKMYHIVAALALVLQANLAAVVPGWTPEQISTASPVVPDEGPNHTFSGVDAHGNFFAIWNAEVNGNTVVMAAINRPGLGWLPETIISNPLQDSSAATCTLKENGEAYVIWQNTTLGEIEVAINPNIGALNWLAPVQISNAVAAGHVLGEEYRPVISSASQISAVVAVWREGSSTADTQVYANWDNGSGWNLDNIQQLSASGFNAPQANVDVGNGGIAIATWVEDHTTFSAVYANVFRFDTLSWGSASTALSSTAAGSSVIVPNVIATFDVSNIPAVEVSGFGIGFLAWHYAPSVAGPYDIQVAFYQPGVGFTPAITFTAAFPNTLSYIQPRLVQNDEGITWIGFLGRSVMSPVANFVFVSSTHISTEGAPEFTTPVQVNPLSFILTRNFDIAVNGLGNALVSWYNQTETFASPVTLGQAPLPQQLVYTSSSPLATMFDVRLSNTNIAEVFIIDNVTSLTSAENVIAVRGVGVVAPQNAPNFSGYTVENRTLSRKFLANKLSWNVTVDPTVASYQLFRNGVPIAAFPVSAPHSYTDVLFDPSIPNIYTLYSLDINGLVSEGVSVTLNQ